MDFKKRIFRKNDLVIDFFQRTEGYIDSKFRNTFSILLKNKYFVMEYIFNKIYEKNIAEHLQKIPMNVINRKDLWIMLFTIALENIENNEWKNPGSSWIWKYFSEIINSFLTMINYSEEFISTSSIIKLFKCNNIKISDVYNRLLRYGLKYDDICKQMSLVANTVEKINSNINYNKKLLQQVYADLNLNQIDPRTSTNLVQFNNNYRKTRKSLND